MDAEDYRALIEVIENQLVLIGNPELADERRYVRRMSDGEEYLPPPRDQLVEMLDTFERFLAIQDSATFTKAMQIIHNEVPHEPPQGAFVELDREEGRDAQQVYLGDAPDLFDLRRSVKELINNILEGSDESPSGAPQ